MNSAAPAMPARRRANAESIRISFSFLLLPPFVMQELSRTGASRTTWPFG